MSKNLTTKEFCTYLFNESPRSPNSLTVNCRVETLRELFLLLSYIFIQGVKILTKKSNINTLNFELNDFLLMRKYIRSIGYTCSLERENEILFRIDNEPTKIQNYGLYMETGDGSYIVKFDKYIDVLK